MTLHKTFTLTVAAAGLLAFSQAAPAQMTGQDNDTGASSQSSSSSSSSSSQKSKTSQTAGSLSSADREFAAKAAQGSMAEIKLGQLAQERGSSEDVKRYGERLVQDHTKASEELKQIAQDKGIKLPDSQNQKNQAEYDRLSKLSGADFDRAYLDHMKRDHKKNIAEFRRESERGQDSDLKAFASRTLPTLQEHLQLAERDSGSHMEHSAAEGARQSTDDRDTRTDESGAAPRQTPQQAPQHQQHTH